MKLLNLALSFTFAFGLVSGSRAADEENSSQLPKKLPAKLPKKTVKKTKVNFEVNSGTHVTTVVVRTPLPLEQALDDQARARHEVQDLRVRNATKPNKNTAVIPPYGAPLVLSSTQEIPQPLERPARADYHLLQQQDAANRKSLFLDETRTSTDSSEATPVKVEAEATAIAEPSPSATPLPAPAVMAQTVISPPAPTPSPTPEPLSTSLVPAVAAPAKKASVVPVERARGESFLARVSYLDAHYDELERDLQNGANSLGLGFARRFETGEGRLQFEAGVGMDQEMAAQNIRYLIARGDFIYFFSTGTFKPFAGAGLGFGNFNVRSQRANYRGGADLVYRQHASGSAFIASPEAGIRADFGKFAVDFSGEYLVVAGAGSSAALGGGVGALTLVLPF